MQSTRSDSTALQVAGGPGSTVAAQPKESAPGLREWIGLVVLLFGTFVIQVDFFVVNVALPTIRHDLSATLSEVQLIAVVYGGTYAITVVTGGRLGDLFGRKRLFISGLIAFAAASAICGAAWSGWVLVAGRVLQGCAAAVVMPQTIGSLHAMFPEKGRDRAFSIFGISMGMAWVSGILLGGILVGADIAHLGWRAIFLINIPLVALVVLGASTMLSESRRPAAPRLDLGGMAVFAVVVALLIIPLIQGRQMGWPLWTYVSLALSMVGVVALISVERGVLRRGESPVISPELFRDRNFRLGLLVIVVFFLGPPGFFLLTTLYLQGVLGFSALAASMSLLPFGAVFVIASYAVKRLKERLGESVIVIGVGIMIAGLIILALTVDQSAERLTVPRMVPAVALIGLGQALVTTPLYEMLLRNVAKDIASTASAVFTTVQLVAQSLSVAFLIIIFTTIVGHQVSTIMPSESAQLATTLRAAGASPADAASATATLDRCAATAAPNLASGSTVTCGEHSAWHADIEATAKHAVAMAARRGYSLTLLFNLGVLIASGVIMATSVRRRRRLASPA